jgi:hypothetical protein
MIILNSFYSKNGNSVYYSGEIIKGSDSKTFEKLAFNYSKDKNNAYLMLEEVIPEVTPELTY